MEGEGDGDAPTNIHHEAMEGDGDGDAPTIDILPDVLLASIMTWTDFGARPFIKTCPAARMASVNRRWHCVYVTMASPILVTNNQLKRIAGWAVQDSQRGGAREVKTISDSWEPLPGDPRPRWWASENVFQGGEWTGNPAQDCAGGPFPLRPRCDPPTLIVRFRRVVSLRALAFEARNRPRKVRLSAILVERSGTITSKVVELDIPPPVGSGLANPPLFSPDYMTECVARYLPEGQPPSPAALAKESTLPVVLPEPLPCTKLRVAILESHERGWVGINTLALFN